MTDEEIMLALIAAGLPHAKIIVRAGAKYFALGIMEMAVADETPETLDVKIKAFKKFVGWANAAALVPPGGQ